MRAVGSTREVPACGFAFGIERLLALLPEGDVPPRESIQALVIPVSRQEVAYALQVARTARRQGISTEMDVTGHGVGAGLKVAAKQQIYLALIVGEKEEETGMVTVRHLDTGVEQVVALTVLGKHLKEVAEEQRL